MTWREFTLAQQGYDKHHRALVRERKGDVALLLTALTGEVISVQQLLGEAPPKGDAASKEAEAEKALRKLKRKMKKAGMA